MLYATSCFRRWRRQTRTRDPTPRLVTSSRLTVMQAGSSGLTRTASSPPIPCWIARPLQCLRWRLKQRMMGTLLWQGSVRSPSKWQMWTTTSLHFLSQDIKVSKMTISLFLVTIFFFFFFFYRMSKFLQNNNTLILASRKCSFFDRILKWA